jgi:hypothetical protein
VEHDEDLNDMNKGLDANHGATARARNAVVGSRKGSATQLPNIENPSPLKQDVMRERAQRDITIERSRTPGKLAGPWARAVM